MDKAQFWRLIEDAKSESEGDCDTQVRLLKTALLKLEPDQIIGFDRILDDLRDAAFRWDLWGAAYLINGGCSYDCFVYFGCWLIAQGQEVYENALQDPDSLADAIEPDFADAECEPLLYAADHAYEQKTQQVISREQQVIPREGPAGTKWENGDLDAMFPRITAKINNEGAMC